MHVRRHQGNWNGFFSWRLIVSPGMRPFALLTLPPCLANVAIELSS
jgi:hypothetical protein